MRITALAGGVGGAKMLAGLARAVDPASLTAIVNTGDDDDIYGVHVSPDVDIVTYRLAGIGDAERGWGIAGDTFHLVDSLDALGGAAWFRLGDRDFATCLFRTDALRAGRSLSEVTDAIRRRLGIEARILPMTNDRVRTRFTTTEGRTLEFQEYFVKERQQPEIAEVVLDGVEDASPAPGVLDSIAAADTVVICPSNPVVSIGPILALDGVRSAVAAHPRVVAVSPIVQGKPLKGPADKLLHAVGAASTASGVAELYRDLCDLFVVDATDPDEVPKVEALGLRAIALDTIMHDDDAAARLATEFLA
ncbi:MAG TPA: 2-phospho-L-lactate transferase [Actinomycetota bacterium]|nr:2-phospho-L-lactate transferase [Actinomycetota bacterium]